MTTLPQISTQLQTLLTTTTDGIVNLTNQHKYALHFQAVLLWKILPFLHLCAFLATLGAHRPHFQNSLCTKMR